MTAELVGLENVAKSFGRRQALCAVSLSVAAGECVAVMGPNGSGKTTLIRILAGRLRATAGSAIFRPGCTIGVVPQDGAVYHELSVRENLSVFGGLNGVMGKLLRERIDWALDWSGLAPRSQDAVGKLSGGLRRCVSIACSMLHRPALLLLDEPTTSIDQATRARIWSMLEAAKVGGAGFLLATHEQTEAERLADRRVTLTAPPASAALELSSG